MLKTEDPGCWMVLWGDVSGDGYSRLKETEGQKH